MQQYNFDTSGNIKPSAQQDLQHADSRASIVAYTSGTSASGRPYYAYIAVKPSKYREFCRRSEARETFRLGDYGHILVYGFEAKPPANVVKHMNDKYGFDEHYEARLREEISKQRKQFSIDQEEQRLINIVAMMKAQKK